MPTSCLRYLIVLVFLVPCRAAWDKGFNFRATAAFVTDGANETYVLADDYPVTRNGVTFGWEQSISGLTRDRDSTIDRRLAGINYVAANTGTRDFRVDLPATGSYVITIALGDDTSAQTQEELEVLDTTTILVHLGPTNTAAANWIDASNVKRTSVSDWVNNNVSVTQTFTTTIFRARLGLNPHDCTISHIFISQSAAAGGGGYIKKKKLRVLLFPG